MQSLHNQGIRKELFEVEFDHYHGESMYRSDKSKQVIQRLGDEDLVKDMDDGRKVIDLDEKNRVIIIKSDYHQE
jgi:arginyl-tRNA synthetase